MGKVLGVIPAHLESTRLPRKVLLPICGHPMLLWVYRRARTASCLDHLLVATDAEEILEICRRHEIPAALTSAEHRSGSDRIFEVLERGLLSRDAEDIYVNVQGDEPMISAEHIELLVRPLRTPAGHGQISTLKVVMSPEEARSPNNVKVVTDAAGRALYFSRAMIPYHGEGFGEQSGRPSYFKHLGLYAYTVSALRNFHAFHPSPLELSERLEQLRFLENGIPIAVMETNQDTIGVDTLEDLQKVEDHFRRAGVTLP
jgi:3-deoxy-manno-octulosonate cytidylyltransferase (CMP-KDO synthetase)